MTLRVGGSASRGGGPFETCPEARDFLEHTWCMRRSPGSQSQSESPGVAPAAQSLAWRSVSENKAHMLYMSEPARRAHNCIVVVGTCVHRGLASNLTLCHAFGLWSFLEGEDLSGPASAFRSAGVTGADFLAWRSAAELVADLVVTPFTARKVLACRDKFLAGN